MTMWRAVVSKRCWHYSVQPQQAESGPVQRRCRAGGLWVIGAFAHRAGASGGQSPELPKRFCLFSFGKHPSIRWVTEQGDPFQPRVCEMEGGAGQKESRDEHAPGVYYCFKWREEQEIIHFHRGVFLVYFTNLHGRHFYSITIIKALLMSLIQQGYHLLVTFIFH